MAKTNFTYEEIEREESASKENVYPYDVWVINIKQTLESLVTPLPPKYCIYKVPKKVRSVNETAYTPQVVSIGPIHYGQKTLNNIQKHKFWYLQKFLQRAARTADFEDFVSSIKEWESRIRCCYVETFDKICNDEFVHMILLDAGFIFELFLRGYFRREDPNDPILHKPWLEIDIEQDLILLENQLPFFILEKLYDLAFPSRPKNFPSFRELTCSYFSRYINQKSFDQEVKHFTDLLRSFQLREFPVKKKDQATMPKPQVTENKPQPQTTEPKPSNAEHKPKPQIDEPSRDEAAIPKPLKPPSRDQVAIPEPPNAQQAAIPKPPKPPSRDQAAIPEPPNAEPQIAEYMLQRGEPETAKLKPNNILDIYSATELHDAGVKLKVSQSKCFLDIDIKYKDGELTIPCLNLDCNTERFIRNLMALEICHYPKKTYICDYAEVMDNLINTPKDVDLLIQKKIIVNKLGDRVPVVTLFNNLCTRVFLSNDSQYTPLCKDLNAYYDIRYHKWKAILSHEYCSTPWRFASTTAAIMLLVFTLTQTIFAIIAR